MNYRDYIEFGVLQVNSYLNYRANVSIKTDDHICTIAESGTNFMIATDAKTFTLPAASSATLGVCYTFTNIGADANNIITIASDTADYIAGTITLAATVVDIGTTVDKDLINTKATAITGDSVTLVCDGVDGWYVLNSTGFWASE